MYRRMSTGLGALLLVMPFAAHGSDCDELSARLSLNGNETVTDSGTGLTWQRCNVGQNWTGAQCSGAASLMSYAAASGAATGTDFRLPTVEELQVITALDCGEPAVPDAWASIESGFYWTADEAFGGFQMTVLMTNGEEYPMSSDIEARVLLVK